MKKETLVAQLEAAKALTSVVSIDNVIALIQQLEETKIVTRTEFKMTPAMFDNIMETVENAVNGISDEIVDRDGVEFELDYNNCIIVTDVPVDSGTIIDAIRSELDRDFEIVEEDECGPSEAEVMQSINQGLGTSTDFYRFKDDHC
jgi:hypothetical protein